MRKLLICICVFFIVVSFEIFNGFWFKSDLERNLISLNALHNVELNLDVEGYYSKQQKISYKRNQFGFRDDCASPGAIDVISIGGSSVDQRYIDFKSTFQQVLQGHLKEINKNICISNAGVDGHKIADHLKALDEWFPLVKNFNPKYYLIYAGLNDSVNTKLESPETNINKIFNTVRVNIYKNSYLFWFYQQIKNVSGAGNHDYGVFSHKKNIRNDYDFYSLSRTKAFDQDLKHNALMVGKLYKKLLKKITARNGVPVCITQSAFFVRGNRGVSRAFKYKGTHLNGHDLLYSLKLTNNEIIKACREQMHSVIDTGNMGLTKNDFYDFVHLNPDGSRKFGKFLFDNLKNEFKKNSI